MRTEDLIAGLARSPATAPMTNRQIMLALLAAVVFPVAVFLLVGGVRPDAPAAWFRPSAAVKSALALVLFVMALPQVPRLARPEGAAEAHLGRLWLVLIAGLAIWVAAFVIRAPAERFTEVNLTEVGECMGFITLISITPAVAVIWLLRRGAVTHPLRAGALGGLAAASGSAAGYSLFCTQDNPLFYVLWYGLAIAVVSLASALVGRLALRW